LFDRSNFCGGGGGMVVVVIGGSEHSKIQLQMPGDDDVNGAM